jgi:phage tail sheath protein FI
MLILDPPADWTDAAAAEQGAQLGPYGLNGWRARNAAIYFPRLRKLNSLLGMVEATPPAGLIVGAYARMDEQRGVWKAPAGFEATLRGVEDLELGLTDEQQRILASRAVNCLRNLLGAGPVIWGARTLAGADALGSEYKYVPVRRLALFIEESIYRGTQWAVFEPNDEPLWAQLRLSVGAFMNALFRQGAFLGPTPRDTYFVQCDATTTTQADIDRGIVNIIVGFAPLMPAEFVVLYIEVRAGSRVDG